MKNKKTLCVVLAAMMSAGILTGCGGSDEAAAAGKGQEAVTETSIDRPVGNISVISREDGSGTRGAFIELFGIEEEIDGEKVDQTTLEANITNSTSVMMTTVSGDANAIGYISLGSLNDTVKAVRIDGVDATAENVKNGSYKVSRPFNIATMKDVTEVTQDFIDFIMSADGQAVVEESGYIKASENGTYEGKQPEGRITVAGSSSVTPVMEKLKEAYLDVNPNAKIEIQQSDSTTGMTSARDGICDIGMASRELKDSETADGLISQVIATDGIAVIVNSENPLNELTSGQVKSIYTGEVVTWEEATF